MRSLHGTKTANFADAIGYMPYRCLDIKETRKLAKMDGCTRWKPLNWSYSSCLTLGRILYLKK